MEIVVFFKGIAIGFSVAAPVGPIGALCIRRALEYGRSSAFFSGLGAAAADLLCAGVAAFGITFISDFLIKRELYFQVGGGLFLLYLGWRTYHSEGRYRIQRVSHTTLFRDCISTFILTLINPLTILSFITIFAAFGVSRAQVGSFEIVTLLWGVFIGSAGWWLLISEGITFLKRKIGEKVVVWVHRVAGCIIIASGLAALLTLFLYRQILRSLLG